ncbi:MULTISPECIES: MoaD/ThiS family protein [Helicobacter]|uniref:MoaD/ThiS family protein n=2 Tax=Helicobacter typhlonius TaxID=76936 RepID=A0A099UGM3_9HELI|nr:MULTISPECIES: MoaD/ThiS family protein [Helicobacter]TLD78609.1 MoaD/ThiS family protein [Helicobacter typhlonius]TLD89361.1 MoaD/ThiS family protein [Helicobacter sp. MIT 03-1616]CUU40138.1 Molybdenum cofactor biosynthesis protein MoaD [Helicobacter typhlonius]HCD73274.1 molybdopterin synthase sulfur carrier subunit [Helicobacter sp.]
MIRVEFLGPISNIPARELEAQSLAELKELLSKDTSLHSWLDISAVAVNDEIIEDLSYPLSYGDKVALLPPVCGG